MKRLGLWLAAAPMLIVGLAGCLGDDAPDTPAPLAVEDRVITDAVDWWEDFSTRWVKRDGNTPMNQEARDFLVAELQAVGLEVDVREYPAGAQGQTLPDGSPLVYYAIVGTKLGTELPDHRIGLVAHYDTQTLTFQGAYDDASGVAAQLTICQQMAQVETRRSISCIFFDGEERGLVASEQYVQDVVVEGDEDFVYDFILGYDMTGINWPGHDWKMYLMSGDDEHQPFLANFGRHVMHTLQQYPMDGVEVLDVHDRNSDERRFREVGIPIYRFAGGRNAADYPEYHRPGDTVDYVYEFVDGRANFEAGFRTVVDGSIRLTQELDATSLEDIYAQYA